MTHAPEVGAGAGATAAGVTAAGVTADEAMVDALLSTSRVLVALTTRTLGELRFEVTLSQYRALVVLASRGPQRTGDLAAELGVRPSTATRSCDRLIRRGLVQRFRRPEDRRVAWLGLTRLGQELVAVTMRRRRAAIAVLVERAGLGHQEAVVAALTTLVEAAGEIPEPQWWDRWATSVVEDGD